MKKKHTKHPPAAAAIEVAAYLPKNTMAFYSVLLFSFLSNFVLYLLTIAPTVTFEDSGEFITAGYNLGVAHEPGYPLFTMLAKLFTLLPLGDSALRVNLLSAFFTAAAGVFVCYAVVLLIENTFSKTAFWKNATGNSKAIVCFSAALCGSILFGTAYTTWEQALITEVYGLNSFFVSLFLVLTLAMERQKDGTGKRRIFYLICLSLGLTLTNHTTSLMLIPLAVAFLFVTDKKLLTDFRMLWKSALFFLAGLTPLAYLPLASLKNPIIDWGNPENIPGFLRVIGRHQYAYKEQQTLDGFSSQISVFFGELLPRQWLPVVLLLAAIGLFILLRKNRPYFYFGSLFLLFTMPVTTYLTNFNVLTPAARFENTALVSVFYIPAYLFIALLAGVAAFFLLSLIKASAPRYALAVCLPLAALGNGVLKTLPDVTMHDYYYARDYCENISNTLEKNSLFMVNWDPFYFPLLYHQFVEHKRPDLMVLDQQLMRRSWYIQWLKQHFPDFVNPAGKEVERFLLAVAPFEANKPYISEVIENSYISMINALIDSKLRAGSKVYFAYTPDPPIMRSFHLEPLYSAYEYTARIQPDTTISDSALKLEAFSGAGGHRDRMANYVRDYYGRIFALRALLYESKGDTAKAVYTFTKARNLFDDNTQSADFITRKLAVLGRQAGN